MAMWMSPPSERGLPKLVLAKHVGQCRTRIDAQDPEDNGGLWGEAMRLEVEVGMDRAYFEGVVRNEEDFGVQGIGVLGLT